MREPRLHKVLAAALRRIIALRAKVSQASKNKLPHCEKYLLTINFFVNISVVLDNPVATHFLATLETGSPTVPEVAPCPPSPI
jgi:hypothetical protein